MSKYALFLQAALIADTTYDLCCVPYHNKQTAYLTDQE